MRDQTVYEKEPEKLLFDTWFQGYREAASYLEEHGVAEGELDAWYLLEAVTGMSKTEFLVHREEPLESGQAGQIQEYLRLIEERAKRIPLSYLTGWRNFCGLEFAVNAAVLIPRQDTECLVEEALPYVRGKDVLDLCTGSGCIGISLAVLGGCRSVTLADLSQAALRVARENAHKNQADVLFVQGDLFENIESTYDVIVANPPYIPTAEIGRLMPEVRDYEPLAALDGAEDGLHFYYRIIGESSRYLQFGGRLCFETGYNQGKAVRSYMEHSGYTDVEIKKDLAGLDRIVTGRRMEE